MSDNDKDAQLRAYKDDPRIPCQYGVKCYQKNPQHHSKYKHPPKRETVIFTDKEYGKFALDMLTLINILTCSVINL